MDRRTCHHRMAGDESDKHVEETNWPDNILGEWHDRDNPAISGGSIDHSGQYGMLDGSGRMDMLDSETFMAIYGCLVVLAVEP